MERKIGREGGRKERERERERERGREGEKNNYSPPAVGCSNTSFRLFTYIFHIYFTHVLNISDGGHSRSGHQVRSSDVLFQNIQTYITVTIPEASISDSEGLTRVIVSTERLSRIITTPDG